MIAHTCLSHRRLGVSLIALAVLALAPSTLGQPAIARSTAVRVELNALLDSMEQAVLLAEIEGYLSFIDTTDAVFAVEQKNWAADLAKHTPETFELELGEDELVLENGTAVVELAMTWNMPDAKRRQVKYPVRFTHSDNDVSPWKYAGEDWAQSEGEFALALYPEGLDNHGEVVIEVWPNVRTSVNERFAVTEEDDVFAQVQQVKLYKSMAHLQSSIFLSYADVHGPLGGWNEPGESIKAMARGRPSQRGLQQLLSHEYGHVCSFVMGPESSKMPWWLLEGLAEYASEPFSNALRRRSTSSLRRLAANEGIAPWDEIADFENTPRQYYPILYRQGHHMVMFVIDTFGDDKLIDWATRMAEGKSLDEATRSVLDMTFDELDQRWRESLGGDG